MNITVVGTGYVGFSLSLLISRKYDVIALDIKQDRVDSINNGISPIKDKDLEKALKNSSSKLIATSEKKEAYINADYIIIATPTNYDSNSGAFDTSTVESVIQDIADINSKAIIVIKSTIPIGFTNKIKEKFNKLNIFFSPEFLRENMALHDNLYPSRIVIGSKSSEAKTFSKILVDCSKKEKIDIPILFTSSKEAEAVKLFANTYLAMRVAFFNELDSFSEFYKLDSKNIIKGLALDDRIGNFYNNPSFGYGGYCLPKDTQQLLQNFKDIPNNIITAVVKSNSTRKNFIVDSILEKKVKRVGIYRLIMKTDSDNFRDSAVLDIMELLKKRGVEIFLYEPLLNESTFRDSLIIKDLSKFIESADLIIANRMSEELKPVISKVYSRDIFFNN
ncbi:nucleotide sugar dehydrogenase [Pelagibacterales bacterium]|nr:nucleotide sugar dehydrogenase [Pelagibacterales bacterium]